MALEWSDEERKKVEVDVIGVLANEMAELHLQLDMRSEALEVEADESEEYFNTLDSD